MATDKDDESKTRNPAFKADLDVKIIKGLSLAKVPVTMLEQNPQRVIGYFQDRHVQCAA